MNLIQRFISTTNVDNPAEAVGNALRLRGRDLIVVSLLEPELFTGPADWLAVLLEYQQQRIEFQNLMLREKESYFLQRLVVYVNCTPPQGGDIYARCIARAVATEQIRHWSAGATTESMTADGKILSSGNLRHLFDDLDFVVEEGKGYEDLVFDHYIDLRTPFNYGW